MQEGFDIKNERNAAIYISHLDSDVDEEFLNFVKQNDDDIYTISFENVIVGLAQAVADQQAFLYVYIFPRYRRKGYGKKAVLVLEQLLRRAAAQSIQTCYRCEDAISRKFAEQQGYQMQYASACLLFSGNPWHLPEIPVRGYQNADFIQTHSMCAEAFHVMRLHTGFFPNSTKEQPDPETEAYWEETANRRFVYTIDHEIVGMVQLEGNEIGCVAVKQTHQGRGIGTILVKFAINRLLSEGNREISLYCVMGNPARSLYEKLGFTEQFQNVYAEKEV